MNKSYINIIFKAIIMAVLLQSCPAQAVNFPWYKDRYHKAHGAGYSSDCSLIHIAQKIRGCALFAYYRTQHRKANLDQAMNLIQAQLKEFESWILELENEALLAIKEKYQITDEICQKYLADTHRVKSHHKDQMLNNHPEVTHDPNVPADIMEILIPLLKQNKINPQSINIKMVSDQKEIDQNPTTNAQAKSIICIQGNRDTNTFAISSQYIPASIEIFPSTNNLCSSQKISICAHEVEHLIQQHVATTLILEKYLAHYCGVTPEFFKKTPEYQTLSQIHEAQAEILSSLRNPITAHHMTVRRKQYFYPEHLYQEHFIHLSTIDMLWKVNAWLEFFHQNGLIKKRDEWLAKIKECTQSVKELLT